MMKERRRPSPIRLRLSICAYAPAGLRTQGLGEFEARPPPDSNQKNLRWGICPLVLGAPSVRAGAASVCVDNQLPRSRKLPAVASTSPLFHQDRAVAVDLR